MKFSLKNLVTVTVMAIIGMMLARTALTAAGQTGLASKIPS